MKMKKIFINILVLSLIINLILEMYIGTLQKEKFNGFYFRYSRSLIEDSPNIAKLSLSYDKYILKFKVLT